MQFNALPDPAQPDVQLTQAPYETYEEINLTQSVTPGVEAGRATSTHHRNVPSSMTTVATEAIGSMHVDRWEAFCLRAQDSKGRKTTNLQKSMHCITLFDIVAAIS